MIRCVFVGVVAALLAGCGDAPVPPVENSAVVQVETERPPRFSEASLAVARKGIEAEPQMVDYLLDPTREVELTVAVRDDGSRRNGYAGYYCQMLRQWGTYDDNMDVRIVNAALLAQANGDFGSISLGTVHCSTGDFWD